jgi:RimJ/RimL family protein N-acetyltransferase
MTETVTLQPVAEDDLPIIESLTQDPAKTGEFAWLGWSDTRFRARWAENKLLSDDGGTLMVRVAEHPAGFVNWRRKTATPSTHFWEIGIALLPEARGHGYGTEAQRRLARYLFAHTTVHRIEAATETGNLAEQAALEKAGFVREGIMRGVGWRDGAWRDGVTYSLLRTDPV